MLETPNLPPMHSPIGPMGLEQLGQAGYGVLKQVLSSTLYDALRGLPDPTADNVEERGLECAIEAPCV